MMKASNKGVVIGAASAIFCVAVLVGQKPAFADASTDRVPPTQGVVFQGSDLDSDPDRRVIEFGSGYEVRSKWDNREGTENLFSREHFQKQRFFIEVKYDGVLVRSSAVPGRIHKIFVVEASMSSPTYLTSENQSAMKNLKLKVIPWEMISGSNQHEIGYQVGEIFFQRNAEINSDHLSVTAFGLRARAGDQRATGGTAIEHHMGAAIIAGALQREISTGEWKTGFLGMVLKAGLLKVNGMRVSDSWDFVSPGILSFDLRIDLTGHFQGKVQSEIGFRYKVAQQREYGFITVFLRGAFSQETASMNRPSEYETKLDGVPVHMRSSGTDYKSMAVEGLVGVKWEK